MSASSIPAEELVLYAMHLLPWEESAIVRERLHTCSDTRDELHNIYGDLAVLSLSADSVPVSAGARQKFLSAIRQEAKTSAGTAVAPPQTVNRAHATEVGSSFPWRALQWAGWAVAAGLALTTGTYYQRATVAKHQADLAVQQISQAKSEADDARLRLEQSRIANARAQAVLSILTSRSAQRFLLTEQVTARVPAAHVTYVASTGSLLFQANDLRSLPGSETYELWLIPADKAARPIGAGTFRPDAQGYASLVLPSLPHGLPAGNFGVTVEKEGGASTPTLPILLTGV